MNPKAGWSDFSPKKGDSFVKFIEGFRKQDRARSATTKTKTASSNVYHEREGARKLEAPRSLNKKNYSGKEGIEGPAFRKAKIFPWYSTRREISRGSKATGEKFRYNAHPFEKRIKAQRPGEQSATGEGGGPQKRSKVVRARGDGWERRGMLERLVGVGGRYGKKKNLLKVKGRRRTPSSPSLC